MEKEVQIQVCHSNNYTETIRFFMPYDSLHSRFNDFKLLEKRWMYALGNDCSFVAIF